MSLSALGWALEILVIAVSVVLLYSIVWQPGYACIQEGPERSAFWRRASRKRRQPVIRALVVWFALTGLTVAFGSESWLRVVFIVWVPILAWTIRRCDRDTLKAALRAKGLCPNYAFDLSSNSSDACPKCKTPIEKPS